jgi:SAM-dependent methyltransferase
VSDVSSSAFWEDLYRQRAQPWDLGAPTPALVDFVDATPPPPGRIAVPGCGRGHDVRYLTQQGYDATGFDFSERAVAAAHTLARMYRSLARFETRDVFELGAAYAGAFDGVWEYTCYCAIHPARRAEYVDVLATIVRPGGFLLACFFPTGGMTGGPPFAVDVDEMRGLVGRAFRIEREFAPERSPEGRDGKELMVHAVRS